MIKTSDYITLGSAIIAITAFVYSYLTNTKKYELTSQYRTKILEWYSDTIDVLVKLKFEAKENFINENLKKELLARLSANIEIGRFYFPNIDIKDGHGKNKPEAYKGYRNLMLDFLVFSYWLFEKREAQKYVMLAENLQRHFTSHLFEILDPKTFLKETKKYTTKSFSKELRFEDLLVKDPDFLDNYIYRFKKRNRSSNINVEQNN